VTALLGVPVGEPVALGVADRLAKGVPDDELVRDPEAVPENVPEGVPEPVLVGVSERERVPLTLGVTLPDADPDAVIVCVGEAVDDGVGPKHSPSAPGEPKANVTLSTRSVPLDPLAPNPRIRTDSFGAPSAAKGSAAPKGMAAHTEGWIVKLQPNEVNGPEGPLSEYCSCARGGPVTDRYVQKEKLRKAPGKALAFTENTGPTFGSDGTLYAVVDSELAGNPPSPELKVTAGVHKPPSLGTVAFPTTIPSSLGQ
jgi:hypothetical protein